MTKKQFLLKQTEEQRAQLDALAEKCGLSRTAYVQRVLDLEWKLLERQRTAEAQVTKAPPAGDPNDLLAPTPCACDGNCAGCGKGEA